MNIGKNTGSGTNTGDMMAKYKVMAKAEDEKDWFYVTDTRTIKKGNETISKLIDSQLRQNFTKRYIFKLQRVL